MTWFKIVAFIGAACLLLGIAPGADTLSFFARTGGAIALMWGGLYFLVRENELLYGVVSIIIAVLVQPFYSIPFTPGQWMGVAIFGAAYLVLAGLLCRKFEKQHEIEHAKIQAELDMYRRNDEKLKKDGHETHHFREHH